MKQRVSPEKAKELTQEWMKVWGDSVGPGWKDILKAGVDWLFLNWWDGTTIQVKEKFGTLRFYCDLPSVEDGGDFCQGIVTAMEFASSFLCEKCGERGRLRMARSWMKTLCPNCEALGGGGT